VWEYSEIVDIGVEIIREGGATELSAVFCLWSGKTFDPQEKGFDYDEQAHYMQRMEPAVVQLNTELTKRYNSPSYDDVSDGNDGYDFDKIVRLANSIGRHHFGDDTDWLDHIIEHGEFSQDVADYELVITDRLYSAWLRRHGMTCYIVDQPNTANPNLEVTFFFDSARPLHLIDQLEAEALHVATELWKEAKLKHNL
jgi:hypothetical protein